MSDEKFHKEIKFILESHLSPKKDNLQIRVKDVSKDSVLEDMNYSKVLFDSELNIYKIDKDGKIVKVDNENFEAIVMKQE